MFANTKAFSGFAVGDIDAAKKFSVPSSAAPISAGTATSRRLPGGRTGPVMPGGLDVLLVPARRGSCGIIRAAGSGLPGASGYPPRARILPEGPSSRLFPRPRGREGHEGGMADEGRQGRGSGSRAAAAAGGAQRRHDGGALPADRAAY